MIRLFHNQAQVVQLALSYLRHVHGTNPEDIARYVDTHPRIGGATKVETQNLKAIAYSVLSNGAPSFQNIVEDIQRQFQKDLTHDSDLIETFVEMLGLEYPRNGVLSGGHLEQVRNAILMPEELRALREKLKTIELSCHQCRHRFRDGEMVTISVDRAGAIFSCARCRLPTYVVCMQGHAGDEGHEGVPVIDLRDMQRIARSRCYMHKAGTEPGTVSSDDVAQRVNTAHRGVSTLFSGFRAGRGWDNLVTSQPAPPTAPIQMEETEDGPGGTENS